MPSYEVHIEEGTFLNAFEISQMGMLSYHSVCHMSVEPSLSNDVGSALPRVSPKSSFEPTPPEAILVFVRTFSEEAMA